MVLLRGNKLLGDEDTEGGKNASEGEGLEATRINSPSPPGQLLDDEDDDFYEYEDDMFLGGDDDMPF